MSAKQRATKLLCICTRGDPRSLRVSPSPVWRSRLNKWMSVSLLSNVPQKRYIIYSKPNKHKSFKCHGYSLYHTICLWASGLDKVNAPHIMILLSPRPKCPRWICDSNQWRLVRFPAKKFSNFCFVSKNAWSHDVTPILGCMCKVQITKSNLRSWSSFPPKHYL